VTPLRREQLMVIADELPAFLAGQVGLDQPSNQ
jgi:hypothetical protein